MLFMLGTLKVKTRPFSIDEWEQNGDASIVSKPVIGAKPPKEFTGDGEDEITISGQILPTRIGGLDQVETAFGMKRAGTRFPLMRGDGWRPGWYAITKISVKHKDLTRKGVGFVAEHSITMTRVDADIGSGQQVVSGLLSLFGALRG